MDPGLQKAKSGGWAQSGALITGNPTKQVSMQVDFDGHVAGDYTIQFNIDPPTGPQTVAARTEALITWSVAGNYVSRRVNVANGVSVSGTGKAVRVVVTDVTDFGGGPPDLNDYQVSIQCAPGARPTVQQPPRLEPRPTGTFLLLPASNQLINIPQDAGAISVFVAISPDTVATIAEGDFVVQQLDPLGIPLMQYDPRNFEWVPLMSGAVQLNLINKFPAGPTPNIWASVVFGIDG